MKSNFFKFIPCNEFQFSVLGNDAHTKILETLRGCFHTFQSVDNLSKEYQKENREVFISALRENLEADLYYKVIQSILPLRHDSR